MNIVSIHTFTLMIAMLTLGTLTIDWVFFFFDFLLSKVPNFLVFNGACSNDVILLQKSYFGQGGYLYLVWGYCDIGMCVDVVWKFFVFYDSWVVGIVFFEHDVFYGIFVSYEYGDFRRICRSALSNGMS